jgi:N-acetylmuramoyl-L-alanine amidase
MSPIVPGTSTANGETVLENAANHVNEKFVLGVLVPKNNAEWKGPWDCAEFVSWVVFQTASILFGCDRDFGDPASADAFTGFWERDAKNLGQIVPIEQGARTQGAAILRLPQLGATGHIVISDGLGGTVEAHSSKDGIIRSTLNGRRWDMAILVPGITYNEGPSVPVSLPETLIYRLTTPLMTGDKVREIQERLKASGFDPGPIDGEFGPHTHAAALAFQLSVGLVPDGEVGPQTGQALGIDI